MKLLAALARALLAGWARAESTATADSIARNLERVESVREVKDLQRTFAQLAQHGRWGEMAGLFSETGVLRWGQGKDDILATSDAISVTGPADIEAWLRGDSGDMDGTRPGSLHTMINEMPVVTLSADGRTAKGRWHVLRLMGDGRGGTRIEGGMFENEYAVESGNATSGRAWKISLLRYYPLFAGDYKDGWKNAGGGNRTLAIVPYHFTPDVAGIPVIQSETITGTAAVAPSLDDLAFRISRLNEEDEVRNLQHAYGYYVDRRMWDDVVDLFHHDGSVEVDGTTYTGTANIRKWLEMAMGPQGLTEGILNEHNIFQTVVDVNTAGTTATTRGLELGMIGNVAEKSASWEFTVFHNRFVRDADSGIWKIKALNLTRLVVAKYSAGWGDGGILPRSTTPTPVPPFLDVLPRSARAKKPENWQPFYPSNTRASTADSLTDLHRRLARSAAFDETENISGAYGYYADDIQCAQFAALHAAKGFKQSPGIGWYLSPERIEYSCGSRYNTATRPAARPRVPFHWRPQPVIAVSHDGRSASLRARILQLGTSADQGPAGFPGVFGFNGGMYHDQFILEDYGNGTTRRKLWCLTIDEFYWQSSSWEAGWAGISRNNNSRRAAAELDVLASVPATHLLDRRQQNDFPPDVSLNDPAMREREEGFNGGPTPTVTWPRILRMWWSYRNPVSGRVPDSYWAPGCVPCRTAKPDWALEKNGFQEPPTGPTLMAAHAVAGNDSFTITVTVSAGPEEPVSGVVELRYKGAMDAVSLKGNGMVWTALLGENGTVTFTVPTSTVVDDGSQLFAYYHGSSRLKPARASVVIPQKSK